MVEYHDSHSAAISDPDRSIIKNWKYPEASETICFLLENVFRAFTCWSLCSDPGSVMRISYGSQTLYIDQQISRREGEYLLTFSCNASPAFIISYLSGILLKNKISAVQMILTFLAADLFCMLFFRFVVYRGHTVDSVCVNKIKKETYQQDSIGVILDVSIMDGFETITRLGGYILLFSLILASISFYWPFHAQSCMLFTAPLELTTGLKQIAGAPLPWKSRYLASMLLTSFGGFCVMAQTKSVLENSLSLIPYAISKCLNASAIFLILVFSDIV